MKLWLIIIIIIVCVPATLAVLHLVLRSPAVTTPFIIAHRGASAYAPENTQASANKAIEQGAASLEIDIHKTKDDVLVVMHNTTVDATTDGNGPIHELSWDYIQTLDAGSSFSSSYVGEKVPRLADILALIQEGEHHLYIEVKEPQLYPGLTEVLTDTLTEHGVKERVTVISFDLEWLQTFNTAYSDIKVGTIHFFPRDLDMVPDKTLVDLYWPFVLLDPTLITRMHKRGYQVGVWTVDNPMLMKLLLWLGVDAITTNRPDIGVEIRGNR
jgi:glycerophosphoryl diester phosphodiesterase